MSPQKHDSQSNLFGALFMPVLVIGALILVAFLVMSFSGNKRAAPSPDDNIQQISAQTMQALRHKYDQFGESQGHADAPVTIREFGDYQCPACGQFAATAERIRHEYVGSGKARFIFFDFPLPMHAHARAAAIAARCAARQGPFWPYHDKLYQSQAKWADKTDPSSYFLDLGLETGLDTSKLKACMKHETPAETLKAERAAGQKIKLRATPTILVDNTKFTGGPSYAKLKTAIDKALAASDNASQNSDKNSGHNDG